MKQNDKELQSPGNWVQSFSRPSIDANTNSIQIEDYVVLLKQKIGIGSYGKIYKAYKIGEENQILACKQILKSKLQKLELYSEELAQLAEKRLKTQSDFQKQLSGQPHITKLFEALEDNRAFYFFMEYCQSDLSKVILSKGALSQPQAMRYFEQLVDGYSCIYQKNAFHRDLKPQNLLLRNNVLKIADFGFVKVFSQIQFQCMSQKQRLRTQSKVGTINYMSPQILALYEQWEAAQSYSAQKADVWSMGIILYKMLFGKEPYSGPSSRDVLNSILNTQLAFPKYVVPEEKMKPANISIEVIAIMKGAIEKQENKRMSFKTLQKEVKEYSAKQRKVTVKKPSTLKFAKKGSTVSTVQPQQKSRISQLSSISRINESQFQSNTKSQLNLQVYKKAIGTFYMDLNSNCTLKMIGMDKQKYYEFTCKLITRLHEKRMMLLKSEENEIGEQVRAEIDNYTEKGYRQLQKAAKLGKETLLSLLWTCYTKIILYEQYEQMVRQSQYFILQTLLMLLFEAEQIAAPYVLTCLDKISNAKPNMMQFHRKNITRMILQHKEEIIQKIEAQQISNGFNKDQAFNKGKESQKKTYQ